MKKALAAAMAAASLMGAAPAQAAAPDPVRVVQRQFVAGHGVKFSEVMTMKGRDKKPEYLRITGTYEFGASGVAAYDVTARMTLKPGKLTTMRIRWTGGRIYMYGSAFDLPEGKRWVSADDDSLGMDKLSPSSQPANIFRLSQLKSLVSHADSVRGGVYRGTFGSKQAVRAGFGRDAGFGPALVSGFSYRLSTDSAGLPSHLRTDRQFPVTTLQQYTDTRYSGWGDEVKITAPPEEQVEDMDDVLNSTLEETFQEVLEIADDALASMRQ
ncbi:hypothetical protein FXF51_33445 [Nonomuraea sp. PA05]|uniref:hypothetical protein n=1 Tax=Nonomuraea sp. PA05 TaxID=2604466 RepID=UPI0011DC1F32|nr:hypothetical protein [Nonomuraea sp. PA05]TYB59909.1 hypothetical protein FXF51_33445 [Nonomuraea sp. PA05]